MSQERFHRHVLISVGERKDKEEIVDMIVSKLLSMKDQIPSIMDLSVHQHQYQNGDKSLEVCPKCGLNKHQFHNATALIADVAMVVVVNDINAYEKHPYYLEVSEFIMNHSALRMRVEYTD